MTRPGDVEAAKVSAAAGASHPIGRFLAVALHDLHIKSGAAPRRLGWKPFM
jgi:hypothetical protein